jgi:hypothetical protein
MLKLKSQVTCSYCSRIFKDPILLPCDDSICREHLSEEEVVKQNKIKCNECKQEFQVNDSQLKSNKAFTKLIESQTYLNEEEISLKQKLEESIRIFFEFYDAFTQNKTQLDLDVFNHFQEMRFKIDEHREKLKERIDVIALEMIEKANKGEKEYLNSLNKKLLKVSFFNETKSLENELNEIELTFRNPNLLIETIKEMQQKQEESLSDIQMKLDEMTKVKDDLKFTNVFKPNLTLLNQEKEALLFGSIKLSGYWLNSLKGEILTNEQQCLELIKLCEFSPNDKFTLLYRATRDGFGSKYFHSKCDGHPSTLTILKAAESSFIFGGFTTVSWDSTSKWKSDANAFIFSLTNNDNRPLKINKIPYYPQNAIYCHSESGPSFGHDIHITNLCGHSYLGNSYAHPYYAQGTDEAQTFLAGSHKFIFFDEIEVYQKE